MGAVTHPLVLLDTSVVIAPPAALATIADRVAVSVVSLAELAYGLHTVQPLERVRREQRYQRVLATYEPIELSLGAARMFGALAATVAASGRQPRTRGFDLLIAATAADLDIPVITRNVDDFSGLEELVTVIEIAPETESASTSDSGQD